MPCAAGFDERRDLAGEFVIDRVFVAADALGIRVGGVDRGQRLPSVSKSPVNCSRLFHTPFAARVSIPRVGMSVSGTRSK